jgi:hypothetical protein
MPGKPHSLICLDRVTSKLPGELMPHNSPVTLSYIGERVTQSKETPPHENRRAEDNSKIFRRTDAEKSPRHPLRAYTESAKIPYW